MPILENTMEASAKALGLCGHGPDMNWSVRFADRFIPASGCACCAIWRGVAFGIVITLLSIATIWGATIATGRIVTMIDDASPAAHAADHVVRDDAGSFERRIADVEKDLGQVRAEVAEQGRKVAAISAAQSDMRGTAHEASLDVARLKWRVDSIEEVVDELTTKKPTPTPTPAKTKGYRPLK